jgi:hypothetical protein
LSSVLSLPEPDASLRELDASLAEAVSPWGLSTLLSEVEDEAEPLRFEEPALGDFLA